MNGRPTRPYDDEGLLSPVRAGVPVEAAVGDPAWLQAMLDAETALVRAQARLGTVPEAAARTIGAAARADRLDVRALALAARETANPVVGLVRALTRLVAEEDPEAAEYVHRGSTSQDILDTGAMLVAVRALRLIRADLARAAAALASLARRHRDTPLAGRTLTLHAVPTTFGLKAAGWHRLLLDADTRLGRVQESLPTSLGGAAGTLAGYVEYARLAAEAGGEGRLAGAAASGTEPRADAEPVLAAEGGGDAGGFDTETYLRRLGAAFAEETGLVEAVLPWHALRTPVADLAGALAFAAGALGKFAVDVQSLARTEVGEVAEPGGAAGRGASSAMPHKRNPVLATLIRSAALQVPALSGALTQCLVTEDERSAGVWHAEWQLLRECLRLTGGAAHTAVELAEGLEVREERMRANLALTGSQVVSERIAAVLAPRLGKVAAKDLLTRASVAADRDGRPLPEVLADAPELSGVMSAEELAGLCDPAGYTGAAGPLVDRSVKGER
ncbi:lyase family protein [Streptomyces sp.]|uniref:lyase family protein n=1 Tax=Streptomyces sp. TaxID=1931 RepID=UPI002F93CB11